MRLYYNHLRFRQSLFYHFFCFIWLLVINQQVKRIFFFKGSNYTNCITWLHPKLLRPPSNQCHSKKYWTVHKANKYWVTILVHGWAQFQLHYSWEVLFALVEFYAKKLIKILKLFKITLAFDLRVTWTRCCFSNHVR